MTFTVTSGTGTIRNFTANQLTLSGTLTKQGSILQFFGGSYNVTGKITGNSGSFDSDRGALVRLDAHSLPGGVITTGVQPAAILGGSTPHRRCVDNALPQARCSISEPTVRPH